MNPYRDRNGGGGILGYSLGPNHIAVVFQGGRSYRYSHESAGSAHVEQMKTLARQGEGLHGYIRQHLPQHEERA